MDKNQFAPSQHKFLLKTLEGAWAFVPPPLPPEINLESLTPQLVNASAAIGELKGAARRLQNPYMLIDPLLRREALTSSAMEGTITTLGELLLEEASEGAPKTEDARETFNYIRAIQAATKELNQIPVSHRLIKNAHKKLLSGLSAARGAGKRPGEYKIHQNAVGKRGDSISTARYVPPPPADATRCMDELEAYINREGQKKAERLIDLALVHYQFEAIHPFDDGNGRIGRMLISLVAQQQGLLGHPLLHLSAYLETRKDEYIDRLFAVSTNADWNGWIDFFLRAVEATCAETIEIVDRIINLQADLKARAQDLKKPARLMMIVDSLFQKWWTTATEAQKICKVTFPTAQSDLQRLSKAGILHELKDGKSRIYYSPEIMSLSDRPAR